MTIICAALQLVTYVILLLQALSCTKVGLCSSGCNGTVVVWDISRGTTLWALDLKTLCVEGMDRLVHAVSLSEQVRAAATCYARLGVMSRVVPGAEWHAAHRHQHL